VARPRARCDQAEFALKPAGFEERTAMRLGALTAATVAILSLAACGKPQAEANSGAENSAATQAAADAANVTSIPGYTPPAGNAAGAARR
jgi:hypothetical protein